MFDAILRIFIDVISILSQQPRPRPEDGECGRRM
jgi:hypothetical protein